MLFHVLVKFVNFLIWALGSVARTLLNLLPDSPFLLVQGIQLPFLAQLNWVFPIDICISILVYWVTAIGIYYVVQIVLRWIKAIQ